MMLATPPGWTDTLTRSHRMQTRVEVWAWEQGVYTRLHELPVSGGTLTLDLDSDMYGGLTAEVADPDMLAGDSDDPVVWTYGHHLRVWFRLLIADTGWTEIEIDCDFLVVEAPTLSGMVATREVKCETPIRQLMDARFLVPWQTDGTGDRAAHLDALLADGLPFPRAAVWDSGGAVVPDLAEDRERWTAAKALLAGKRLIPRGVTDWRVMDEIDPTTLPTVATVKEQVNLLAGTVPMMGRQQYNAVVAYNPEDPDVYATAYDTTSSFSWDSGYGHRPAFYTSPLLDAGTVQDAADTRLASINGKAREVELEAVCDPSIQPGDRVEVTWPSGRVEPLMVMRCEYPLAPGPMRLGCVGIPGEGGTL